MRVLGLRSGATPQLRPRVGVMLQDGVGGYREARALELLRLFAVLRRAPAGPRELLELVGLAEVAGTAVKRLSGGQQQRLSLALALVGRPELVFLDEPTAGMDPQARRATWELIRQLRADGVSVVLTTHFLDEAEQLADTVVVIDAGRVVAAGTPAELTRAGARGPDPVPRPGRAAARPRSSPHCRPARRVDELSRGATWSPATSIRNCSPPSPRGARARASSPRTWRSSGAASRTCSSSSPAASCVT